MNLQMDPSAGAGYSSSSQIARRVSEDWAARNLFCLACSSARILSEPPNRAVLDYRCPECSAEYQLKSQHSAFGTSVNNSAYGKKIEAVDQGRAPHYVFLRYSTPAWRVTDLFVVPGHFFTRAVVEERPPLKKGARREGWVGSKILLNELPAEAQVSVVDSGIVRNAADVRSDWKKFDFLRLDSRAHGGWGAEILSCVRRLYAATGNQEFTLQDFYAQFTDELARRHPENHHGEPKIRQQLQVLRKGNVLKFLGKGRYRVIG